MLANNLSTSMCFAIFELISCALTQHSFTRTKNFSRRARPSANSTGTHPALQQVRPAPTRKTVHVPVPAPQMRVLATRTG